VLRVVYFHGSDREPLAGHQERLTRIMEDISAFYRDGLKRYGIASEGLPLEKSADGAGPDGRAIFIVKGDGKELHRSERLRVKKTAVIDLDIRGVKELTLETESGLQHNHTRWAVWGMPVVKRQAE